MFPYYQTNIFYVTNCPISTPSIYLPQKLLENRSYPFVFSFYLPVLLFLIFSFSFFYVLFGLYSSLFLFLFFFTIWCCFVDTPFLVGGCDFMSTGSWCLVLFSLARLLYPLVFHLRVHSLEIHFPWDFLCLQSLEGLFT